MAMTINSRFTQSLYPLAFMISCILSSGNTFHTFMSTRQLSVLKSSKSNTIIPQGRMQWEKHWSDIINMRGEIEAAVDSMGAQALASRGSPDRNIFRFQTLIGTMLSPQTKDAQTSEAFNNLLNLVHSDRLVPSSLAKCSIESIEKAIKMTSFYTVKARNILEAANRCRDEFGNDIPRNIDDLLSFKGVGPKVAYLTFTIAWGENLGICVDTHVHRISNRLDWVKTWDAKSNGPEKTRKELQTFIPQEKWGDVNFLLVGFGQTICGAVKPKCASCSLNTDCRYFIDPSHMKL